MFYFLSLKTRPEIRFRWVCPRRISEVVADMVCDVTGLNNENTQRIHAARLMLYRSDMDSKPVSPELMKHVELSEAKYEIFDKLLGIGEPDDGLHVQVQWKGLYDKVDWTWNAVTQLYEDIPEKLMEFLR